MRARVLLFVLALSGCVPAGAPLRDTADDPIIDGVATFERPEIGWVSLTGHGTCTATLIAPDVLLTAAHCTGYQTTATSSVHGWFTVERAQGDRRSYDVERYTAFGNGVGADDLALIRLWSPVPASVAVPTSIAARTASAGAVLTMFGYGCTSRDRRDEPSLVKRAFAFHRGRSNNLCPGDSGGPGVLGFRGPIVSVNSGFYTERGGDIFADPVASRAALEAQLASWGPPPSPEVVRLENLTGAWLWARCDAPEEPGCSGWTAIRPGRIAELHTYRRRLLLDNQEELPSARFSAREVIAPRDAVAIYANTADPFAPVDAAPPPVAECLGAASSREAAEAPDEVEGRVCGGRDTWFARHLVAGDRLEVRAELANAAGDLDLELYGPDGQAAASSRTTTDVEEAGFTAAATGDAWIRVFGYRGAANDVHLWVAVTADTR